MEIPEGQETNTKTPMNKTKLLVLVVLVVAAVLLVLANRNPDPKTTTDQKQNGQSQSQKPEIPKELILGQKIETQVALDFPDPNKVSIVQFTTTESTEKISLFYKEWFANNGFAIVRETNSEKGYFVTAEDSTRFINITALTAASARTIVLLIRNK